ncbi:hypothetical protein [Brucella tritici]|uniref:Uncharacterized protein n=1 Tax=Brucella tritici TaxID=94626 RepID=A0A6L3Y952_9HYPH|nr:hypothetical protein [Brucella tritici]KAB2679814.1 hypothetical protein F9L08_22040 [Brucella tritici]
MIQFQTAPVFKPAPLCAQNIIGKLADTMLEMAFSGQNVTPETLESYGFSKDESGGAKVGHGSGGIMLLRAE